MTTTDEKMLQGVARLHDATEAALRAEADRIAARRLDVIRQLTDADREAALLRFADLTVQGEFPGDVLTPVIARLAKCDDSMLRFHDLCDAVRQRGDFDDNPVDWAAERDLSCSAEAIANLRDRLDGDIAWAVHVLLTPAVTS